jgi:hypothetical protein
MDDLVPFGGGIFFAMLCLLLFARGMDVLSTLVATPNLVLEANPIVRKLGWKWSILLNLVFCVGLAISPLSAIIISTMSVLVAARNFQSAWLMRTLGEEHYRSWHAARLRETRFSLFMLCLLAQAALTALVGCALMYYSPENPVPFAIGLGIIIYAIAVVFYTSLSVWRLRRSVS